MGLEVRLKKRVNGFTLDVEWNMDNEIVVLFGYSGAGKSMTLQMVTGLMRPDEGYIASNGKIFFDSSKDIDLPPQGRPFGYVFQDLALFPHMTVKENIQYGANGMDRTERHKKTMEMIRAFHLDGLEDRLPREVSGGQKQRIAIARALIRRPDVLLLDEPFSALDNPLRLEMRGLLKEVRSEFNIPVVLVTHDITEALTMADRLIVYSGGKAVQTGTPEEIYLNPATDEVVRLVHTMPEYPEFLHSFGLSSKIS
ncbi:MAG: ATP-binding cassette domain-containing protein [Thermodesulfovibrionales bacterium]|jgi:molybdate transport system ATP-binding protein|nr:ATP-binding cassette domain-containing protein [Thermodesulfovibrionales bacterium]RJR13137.1 MAG: ATP-binding cassette domain-containing protein [Candidatus Parcubacteria bacterium]